ncbi:hypothetical protein L21SP2_2604 [Salinispira pacifica]|uniref:Uncharacterized protein n=1 Tax=Salinispira pacifica TaxID=1307761 RepID=V5WL83_9SPIO|nr:hypothetical protein L21SP2_2604 [Salinispira pacifica]
MADFSPVFQLSRNFHVEFSPFVIYLIIESATGHSLCKKALLRIRICVDILNEYKFDALSRRGTVTL